MPLRILLHEKVTHETLFFEIFFLAIHDSTQTLDDHCVNALQLIHDDIHTAMEMNIPMRSALLRALLLLQNAQQSVAHF